MRLSDKINLVLGERFGIVSMLAQRNAPPGAPSFYHIYTSAANTEAFTVCGNARYGGGASISREYAMAKAVGESVERYCSAIYLKEHLPFSSYLNADFRCVHPSDFAFYTQEQCEEESFAFTPFLEQTPVHWVWGYDYGDGQDVAVPASCAYVPYYFDETKGELPIHQPISTGLSCHGDVVSACLGSISEVIERDAFMLTWQGALSPPQIDTTTLPSELAGILAKFSAPNEKVHLLDITTDSMVPVIMAVLRDESGTGPPIVMATASDPSASVAARKALEELAHSRFYVNLIFRNMKRLDRNMDFNRILTEKHHMNFWCDIENLSKIQFLFENDERKNFNQIESLDKEVPEKTLSQVVDAVNNTGHRAIFVDLTTRDVAQAGFRVIRAIIPGYQPLAMGYRYRSLGGTRLWTVPQKLGYAGLSRGKDNPVPHPFP